MDGAAVKQVGELTFRICREMVDEHRLVPEGKVCTAILDLYNDSAIVVEPAGALPYRALDLFRDRSRARRRLHRQRRQQRHRPDAGDQGTFADL